MTLTLRCVRVTIFAVEKQYVTYSEYGSVFLPLFFGMQSASFVRCIILSSFVWLYQIFPHYFIKVTIRGGVLVEHKVCFGFLYKSRLKYLSLFE